MINKSRYIELLEKYLDETINYIEREELFIMSSDESIRIFLEEMIESDWNRNEFKGANLSTEASEEILRNILASENNTNQLVIKSSRRFNYQKLAIAAIFFCIFLTGIIYYSINSKNNLPISFEASIPKSNLTKTNNTNQPLELLLEDGSRIKLLPNASLSFPKYFTKDKREVYLTGEALFVISKNPNKPFLVYYDNIVTRVLGTSFTIKTNVNTQNVEVSVITGKVHVFENSKMTMASLTNKSLKSVILVPNQKTIYNIKSHDFETTLADSIYSLPSVNETVKSDKYVLNNESFVYEKATSLKQIFSQLELIYGVEIIVDNENIYNCVFTGDVSKLEMLKKLNTVCLTVGATYEVKGTKVLVSGKGCN
jgi:transmembrane sensor